jgi:hypothetical protein
VVSTKDITGLAKQLETAEDRAEMLRRIKIAVSETVARMRIWTVGNVVKKVALVRVEFRDGSIRFFGCRTKRGEKPVAFSDGGRFTPSIADVFSDLETVETMAQDWLGKSAEKMAKSGITVTTISA